MNEQVRWGVLGAAKIAVEKVIPAMRRGECAEVAAIASRNLGRAQRVAAALCEVEQTIPLEDALHNMAVIDAVFHSARTGAWEVPAT